MIFARAPRQLFLVRICPWGEGRRMRDASLPLAPTRADFSSICRFGSSVGSRAGVTVPPAAGGWGPAPGPLSILGGSCFPISGYHSFSLCSSSTSDVFGVSFPCKLPLHLK